MNRELKLTNKVFAEEVVARLNEEKSNAKFEEKDGKFVVTYDLAEVTASDDATKQHLEHVHKRIDSVRQDMWASVDKMYSYIDQCNMSLNKHKQGHLPELTASAMTKLLKTCGMDGDYSVQPKVIYASNGAVEFGASELKEALGRLESMDDSKGKDADVNRLMETIRSQKTV